MAKEWWRVFWVFSKSFRSLLFFVIFQFRFRFSAVLKPLQCNIPIIWSKFVVCFQILPISWVFLLEIFLLGLRLLIFESFSNGPKKAWVIEAYLTCLKCHWDKFSFSVLALHKVNTYLLGAFSSICLAHIYVLIEREKNIKFCYGLSGKLFYSFHFPILTSNFKAKAAGCSFENGKRMVAGTILLHKIKIQNSQDGHIRQFLLN